jgi:hypothetical protein
MHIITVCELQAVCLAAISHAHYLCGWCTAQRNSSNLITLGTGEMSACDFLCVNSNCNKQDSKTHSVYRECSGLRQILPREVYCIRTYIKQHSQIVIIGWYYEFSVQWRFHGVPWEMVLIYVRTVELALIACAYVSTYIRTLKGRQNRCFFSEVLAIRTELLHVRTYCVYT